MKYIRTKDGKIIKHPHPNAEIFTSRYEIVKSADRIEELCDEFVWVWNKNEFPYSCYRQHTRYAWGDLLRSIEGEENYGKYLNNDYEIFGAIWTDKGLIFVARMNNKGVLELL